MIRRRPDSKPLTRHYLIALAAELASFVCGHARSEVRLPALVGSGMVLQRDMKIAVWGWADPGETVRVRFKDNKVQTRADREGHWSIRLGPFPAGGPYEMSIVGKNALTLHDVLIGDVWLASGQSNMEMPLEAGPEWQGGIENASHELASAHFPRIRLFAVTKAIGSEPKSDVSSQGWRAVTPETVGAFSAVAYLFGRELHQHYQVPIGVIQSVWGGTVAEAWMSDAGLRAFPEFRAGRESLRQAIKFRSDYERYVRQQEDWYRSHGTEDRGRTGERALWADPAFDASGWPVLPAPRPERTCGKDLKGFDGAVWFRRPLTVTATDAGQDLLLHLEGLIQDDVTYWNGQKVGETQGTREPKEYLVPGRYVHEGQNVLAVRLAGYNTPDPWGCTGMLLEDEPHAKVGHKALTFRGDWRYQPAADLNEFPEGNPQILAARTLENAPTALFNGMIHPLTAFKIKGAIWYQGEANAIENRAVQYRTLFPGLIEDWRHHWGYEFPFLFVQLAGVGNEDIEPAESSWAELREAQSMALSVPLTGMATAVDVGDRHDIHPKRKREVAHRLALAAEKVAYGENIVDSGPSYRSMRVEGGQIRIELSNLGSGFFVKDPYGYIRGFQIAGSDGKFHWAQARQDGRDVVVSNETIKAPVAVRYDWSTMPDGNVYDKEGLPLLPFRTDAPVIKKRP